jgi:hypothetical protein
VKFDVDKYIGIEDSMDIVSEPSAREREDA